MLKLQHPQKGDCTMQNAMFSTCLRRQANRAKIRACFGINFASPRVFCDMYCGYCGRSSGLFCVVQSSQHCRAIIVTVLTSDCGVETRGNFNINGKIYLWRTSTCFVGSLKVRKALNIETKWLNPLVWIHYANFTGLGLYPWLPIVFCLNTTA